MAGRTMWADALDFIRLANSDGLVRAAVTPERRFTSDGPGRALEYGLIEPTGREEVEPFAWIEYRLMPRGRLALQADETRATEHERGDDGLR